MKKILLLHNIATSYYKNIVFNEFYKIHKNFKVIHLAETEKIRDWKIDLSDIKYPYEIFAKGSLNDYSALFFIKKMLATLKKENPDIVYIGGYFQIAYWIALFWAKLNNKKVILEMDSNKFDHKRVFLKELIKKFFVKFVDVGITYGKLSKSYFIELGLGENKIVIKPNVTDSSLFKITEDKHILQKKYNFIYVGRFSEEKNLLLLLNAFDKAKQNDVSDDWGLVLVGSGRQEKELKKHIKLNKIQDVEFTGFVDKNELAKYYTASTVFVLPSISEPWGLVANEAMACGKPVIISSQCGCSLDLVNKNGYIFNPWNEEELSEIMTNYIKGNINIEEQSLKSSEIIKDFTPKYAAEKIKDAMELL